MNTKQIRRDLRKTMCSALLRDYVDPFAECDITDTNGLRPIFIHNPKTGGTSLREALGCNRKTIHLIPEQICNRHAWERRTSIVCVRHPIEKFISSYKFHVLSDYKGVLYKNVGPGLKRMNAMDYMNFLRAMFKRDHWRFCPQTSYIRRNCSYKTVADIILRVEDSMRWTKRLREFFPSIEDIPRENVTGSKLSGFPEMSRLNSLTDVRRVIDDYISLYRQDFDVLGYNPENPFR